EPAAPHPAHQRTRNWLQSAAVAAAVALGIFMALELTGKKGDSGEAAGRGPIDNDRLSLVALQNQSIREVVVGPKLEMVNSELKDLDSYLRSRKLPGVTEDKLPPGLEGVKAVGCKLLELGKANASLLCFDKNGQVFHLVVVRREDLEETDLATIANIKSRKDSCRQCPVSKVSVATWGDDERAFALLGETDPDELLGFF
ncbi:MAG: hypothetical protein GWO24_28405, partial [Akkermansiaceae bacterium]|nr:hypothetical protein [Akkermansiaceae bacterium]